MDCIKAQSGNALAANLLVAELQQYFTKQLATVVCEQTESILFQRVEWLRKQGKNGGGVRYVANNKQFFNRASINISQLHYADVVSQPLSSATALSSIIHPHNPYAASLHLHISWTQMKSGTAYWRLMADLNPALANAQATRRFTNTLKQVAANQYAIGAAQGQRYFTIPALGRRRGVAHFYLEAYDSGNFQADSDFANALGRSVIETYTALFKLAIQNHPQPTAADYSKQLDYHTVYLFQVLTMDKGTTSGLLAHQQNDLGIMGSLPSHINKPLLASWQAKLPPPQNQLLAAIVRALPAASPCPIDDEVKRELANIVRQHYSKNPAALAWQASHEA